MNSTPKPESKLNIMWVPTDNIEKYEMTGVDFFEKILNLDYYRGYFTDKSLLYHIVDYKSEEIINSTLLTYNVDISDVIEGPIWKIFEKIEKKM